MSVGLVCVGAAGSAWYGKDSGELKERRMRFVQVEESSSVSTRTAKEMLPETE